MKIPRIPRGKIIERESDDDDRNLANIKKLQILV
jgi:hypothetical protein